MSEFIFEAEGESATDRFGAALAAALLPGTTVALCGTLGAGKTRLVQAIAAAYGIPREEVVSPTFVLCQTYRGSRTVNHLDAYRLHDEDEFCALGVEELFATDAITIIEWADRVAGALPDDHVQIEIEVTGQHSRRFVVRSLTPRLESILTALSSALNPEP